MRVVLRAGWSLGAEWGGAVIIWLGQMVARRKVWRQSVSISGAYL